MPTRFRLASIEHSAATTLAVKGSTQYKVHFVVDGAWRGIYQGVMPRKRRVEYPGAMYHVMSRGDRRANVFLDDVDRQDFVKTLAEACQKADWQIHAYCLMPIAARVHLGTSKGANTNLHKWMRASASGHPAPPYA